jgi:hypothetical protein
MKMTNNINQDRDSKTSQKQSMDQNKTDKKNAVPGKDRDSSWSSDSDVSKDRR